LDYQTDLLNQLGRGSLKVYPNQTFILEVWPDGTRWISCASIPSTVPQLSGPGFDAGELQFFSSLEPNHSGRDTPYCATSRPPGK
jgi:hypothetical protein